MKYVLHHNDCDGYGAAWAAYKAMGKPDGIQYHPVDYGWKLPEMEDGSDVYILDFSLSKDELDALVSRMNFVQILDHHKSAFESIGNHPNAFFDMNRSGAGIAWDYFHKDVPRPAFIDYIEDADLWKFSLPYSKDVKNSLFLIDLDIEAYDREWNVPINKRIEEGQTITKYMNSLLKIGSGYKHIIEIDEFKMVCVPSCLLQSDFGNHLFVNHVKEMGADFAGVYFNLGDGTVKFSTRSVGDFDVSVICKRFGGGGHRNAAGFQIDETLFSFKKISSEV
jgi:oligoribonuclease NrnB/cAMP/cGMP phosphodiesterase (DHH superfamily)